jgi:hypothetical protein
LSPHGKTFEYLVEEDDDEEGYEDGISCHNKFNAEEEGVEDNSCL